MPAEWTDVDGSPFNTDDGQEWASMVASTDIDTYFTNYKVSGMDFADCGGTDTEGFAIVAVDNASTHVVFLRAQIAEADDPEAVYVLASTFQASISRAA